MERRVEGRGEGRGGWVIGCTPASVPMTGMGTDGCSGGDGGLGQVGEWESGGGGGGVEGEGESGHITAVCHASRPPSPPTHTLLQVTAKDLRIARKKTKGIVKRLTVRSVQSFYTWAKKTPGRERWVRRRVEGGGKSECSWCMMHGAREAMKGQKYGVSVHGLRLACHARPN